MPAIRPISLASATLIALSAMWIACCMIPAAVSASGPTGLPCSAGVSTDCARAPAIAKASDSEGEEPEEELEEGGEEAATAEAEAEETGSEAISSSGRSGGLASVVLSHLRLTVQASTALERHRPSASAIGFSFMLSAPSKVRVTLVEQTTVHGHEQWTALPDSLTVNAGLGHVSRNLTGHNRLSPGRYRLTLRPLTGRSRSIYLSARR
jgi:hypothetical protein